LTGGGSDYGVVTVGLARTTSHADEPADTAATAAWFSPSSMPAATRGR
jgi:hypothetical protein